ncbi:AAA family ATPase [Campylobacter coli]|nr:helicase DnaB [Campylobacter coli]EHD2720730.1 AAA family ATPase [Campylobacter coli]
MENIKKFSLKLENFQSCQESWLLKDLIPKESLGLIYGSSGSGKTSVCLYFCKEILKKDNEIRVFYINADMGLSSLKKYGFTNLLEKFTNRFFLLDLACSDKKFIYFEKICHEIIKMQEKFKVFVIIDSLNCVARKIGRLIDPNYLFSKEKIIRKKGGTVLFIHHLNKSGVFSDSHQIVDYADYCFQCFSNLEKKSILLIPKKSSRYGLLKEKAFLFDGLKIIGTTEAEEMLLSEFESKFINLVFEILKIGTIKQNELIDIVYRDGRTRFGKNRIRILLQKHAKNPNGKWCMKQEPYNNNSIYYCLGKNKNEEKR